MKDAGQNLMPKIRLTVLATLCFVTLIMCQTRFKITKEISREVYPPVMRSKECWFLYTIGNPDSFKCVLRVFIVITSPVLSLISTALLLLGKIESNPYFFIPWLFLTVKGLLLVQTDNLISILREMSTKANYTFGFRMEDLKWMLFYFTIFLIDLVETFSFCEIFDLFLVLWNHQPKCNVESTHLEAVKKDIADIMHSFSKCSLGSLSKISLRSSSSSETNDDRANIKETEAAMNFLMKGDNIVDRPQTFPKPEGGESDQNTSKSSVDLVHRNCARPSSNGDVIPCSHYGRILKPGNKEGDAYEAFLTQQLKLKGLPHLEGMQGMPQDLKNNCDSNFDQTQKDCGGLT